MAAVARFAYDLQNTGTPRLRERLNPCFTHAASSPVLRRFRLDLSATTEHKVNIMAKHFDPSIGQATQFKKGLPSANPGGRPKVLGDVQELARQKSPEGINTLSNVMNDEKAPPAARVAAANALLDRGYGKPTQPISQTLAKVDPSTISDEELVAIAMNGT